MQKNEGKWDRISRVSVGVALIVAAVLTQQYWLLIGIVPLATGLVGFCPAYRLLGISTCPVNSNNSN